MGEELLYVVPRKRIDTRGLGLGFERARSIRV